MYLSVNPTRIPCICFAVVRCVVVVLLLFDKGINCSQWSATPARPVHVLTVWAIGGLQLTVVTSLLVGPILGILGQIPVP